VEELPTGVLRRWKDGRVPAGIGSVPEADRILAAQPLRLS
jgi:ribosomal-protein-alanine N-acetyltransferase